MLRTRLQAEQRVEPIFELQLVKLVAAAHVFAIDKDLRYFAIAVRAGHHFLVFGGMGDDVEFCEFDVFLLKQTLCPVAEATKTRTIDLNLGQSIFLRQRLPLYGNRG